ncbi:MAG: hypothetical protein GF381_04755 [Candidatus Pacebacteria bacterium]|nr:hypothetical protein [Candidatus Paceibacterota bacterium]
MKKNLILSAIQLLLLVAVFFQFLSRKVIAATYEDYNPISPQRLREHLDLWSNLGADGFLIWQYSGNLGEGEYFENDQYSFFQETTNGQAICSTLKDYSGRFNFIGVNMWSIGYPTYSSELIYKHFSWLFNECGVNTVRVFAKAGNGPGMQKVLNTAAQISPDFKIIIAVGDYSNGGGGIPHAPGAEWYADPNNWADHEQFSKQIVSAVKNHPNLRILELANEPHCGGASNPVVAIAGYKNWGQVIGTILQQATNQVGFGQMADRNGVCDSPSGGGFIETNSISPITTTSAHYYNQDELDEARIALQEAQSLGKPFYLGEVNWLNEARAGMPYRQKPLDEYITYPLAFYPDRTIAQESEPNIINRDEFIYNLVIDQGYEAHCASPKLFITREMLGQFRRHFELEKDGMENNGVYTIGGSGVEKINMTDSSIAMFRGREASPLTKKSSSYEGFFGMVDPDKLNAADEPGDPIHAGAATSLLTLEQQCLVKYNNLVTAKTLCEELEDPEQCALHYQLPEPRDSNLPYYLYSTPEQEAAGEPSLLNKLNQYYSGSQAACSELTQTWTPEMAAPDKIHDRLQASIQSMSLNLDRVYRLAFVVISPQQDPDRAAPTEQGGQNRVDPFWLLSPHYDGGQKNILKHSPIFVAFKIPDFATNRTTSLPFADSGQLTAKALTAVPGERWSSPDKLSAQEKEARQNRVNQIKEMQAVRQSKDEELMNEKLVINCSGMPQCEGAHGTGQELQKALVDIINGTRNACLFDTENKSVKEILSDQDNPNPLGVVEYARDISVPGNYQFNESRYYAGEEGMEEFATQKSQDWNWNLNITEYSTFKSFFNNPADKTISVPVTVHIVAPIGTNLTEIEKSLASMFSLDALEYMVTNNTMPDSEGKMGNVPRYFPIEDGDFGFESLVNREFYDPDQSERCKCAAWDPDGACIAREICQNSQFSIKLKDDNVGLFFKGAKLGWMIRKLQETGRDWASSAYKYVASCQRVEDLFLGRCGEKPYGPPTGIPYNGTPPVGGKCKAITDNSSPCSVDYLKSALVNFASVYNSTASNTNQIPVGNDEELTIRATQASIICNAESGGNPEAQNLGCQTGSTVDYSVGLFQINLLAHSCSKFIWNRTNQSFNQLACSSTNSCSGTPTQCCSGYFNFSWTPPTCEVNTDAGTPAAVTNEINSCTNFLLDPLNNIMAAFQLSGGGKHWGAWATAKDQHCGPDLELLRRQ